MMVDVATGWSEFIGVWGKGQQRVGTAVHHVRGHLPFPLLGLDSDNGSEFINQDLIGWCQVNPILSELLTLSTRISEMDAFLDHVSCNVIPHQLLITQNQKAIFQLSESGIQSMKSWQNARKDRLYEGSLEELGGFQRIIAETIEDSQLTEDRVWKKLDVAMKSEKGYSLTEWLHLFHAMIASFYDYERLKVLPKEGFVRFLSETTKLDLKEDLHRALGSQ